MSGDDTDLEELERTAYYDLLLPRRGRVLFILGASSPRIQRQAADRFDLHVAYVSDIAPANLPRPDDSVLAAPNALPFATHSIDCIVLPRTIDDAGIRRSLLAEAHRMLGARGILILEGANLFDIRAFPDRLLRRRPAGVEDAGRASWRKWRALVRGAGFRTLDMYALAKRPSGALAMVSMSHSVAAAHYRYEFERPLFGSLTRSMRAFRLLARLRLMPFLEPSFLICARK